MEKSSKTLIILVTVLSFLLGGVIGGLIGHFAFPKKKTEIITVYDSSKEKAKIDSLNTVIKVREDRIEALLDSAKHIKTVVVVKEIEKIKELPLTENVETLKENLVKHGELTTESDSLPTVVSSVDSADTLALLSENNVKDVNIIVAKYEGEVAVNNKLEEAIEDSKVVMSQKDSIIDLKSSIILNQEIGYTAEIKGLQKSLKKEKVKKTVWISVLGAVAATLGVLSVVGR